VKRVTLVLALAAAGLALGAGPAAATNECNGLMVCVPVAGPWVVVPTGTSVPRPVVQYQLSCPRGYVVGGLDAELSDRGIDLSFSGMLGAPVNPGITTARAALFAASSTGSARAPSFRPHLGCMPASGGGGIPTLAAVVPPGKPTVRRVKDVELAARRTQRVTEACLAGERLVGAWRALSFRTAAPPAPALVARVTHGLRVARGRVVVTVHSGAIAGSPAAIQVGAVCAGGGQ
jgi:hypothetical protein